MTTALDRLRGFASSARRDSTIATAEAGILDRLVRVAEDEAYGDDADGALEKLADNLRWVLDGIADHDDADDDLPSTGCRTCDAVLDTLAECHGMSLRGTTASEVAESARDWIGDLILERNEARVEVERLRAEVASQRKRVNKPGEWTPGASWALGSQTRASILYMVWSRDGYIVTHRAHGPTTYMCDTPCDIGPAIDTLRGAIEWCEAQMVSAPTVGATDAGPDAPACDVEGDAGEVAQQGCAVPTAPGPATEVAEQGSGADRISTIAQAQAVDVSTADAMRGPDGEDDR